MANPEADVVKFLEKLIEKNKGKFKKQGDFFVRPGIAYDRFDLTAVQGSYDMSLQGLVHHFLYAKGHYKKLLPADEFKKCEAIVKKDPENIYRPETDEEFSQSKISRNEGLNDTLDEIHNAALMAVGRKLKSLKFEIPDEFQEIMSNYEQDLKEVKSFTKEVYSNLKKQKKLA